MTAARFSTFELLLLQSRDQADSAALLLLAWVLTQQGPVGESERAHLVALTGAFRHGHELSPLLEIAASQDLGAIQLAAEVLQKELHGETSRAFLRLAVTLATEDAEPTLANHHILRFLADLLGVSSPEFAALYASQAGRPLSEPADPSRSDYWQRRERGSRERRRKRQPDAEDQTEHAAEQESRASRREQRAEARRQAREAKAEAKRQRQAEKEEEKARQYAEREAERRRKQARREAERERQRAERETQRERRRDDRERKQERHDDRGQHSRAGNEGASHAHHRANAPDPRIRSALVVLGLEPGASRGEIRKAYRRLAQAHHPDRFHREGEAIVASASRRFQRIRRAYDFLMKVS